MDQAITKNDFLAAVEANDVTTIERFLTQQDALVATAIRAAFDMDLNLVELLLASSAWTALNAEMQSLAFHRIITRGAIPSGDASVWNILAAHGAEFTPDSEEFGTIVSQCENPTIDASFLHQMIGLAMVGSSRTLLHAIESDWEADVGLQLELGADPRATSDHQRSMLHYAVGFGFPEVVRTLLTHAVVDLDALDASGDTPMLVTIPTCEYYASYDDPSDFEERFESNDIDSELVRIIHSIDVMLEYGADADICGRSGYALLHFAVKLPITTLTRVVLERGVNPNVWTTNDRDTPLHIVASVLAESDEPPSTALAMLDLLVRHGANLHIENAESHTAYELLRQSTHGFGWLASRGLVETSAPRRRKMARTSAHH